MFGFSRRKPTVYLFNDTSAEPHAGCRAVMRSIYNQLSHCRLVGVHKVGEDTYDPSAFREAEWIVVNGEGTIHHNAPKGEFLLRMLQEAQFDGKRTALINAVYQQPVNNFPGMLAKLDYFTVREKLSADCARLHGGSPLIKLDMAADQVQMRRGRQSRNWAEWSMGPPLADRPAPGRPF